MITRIEIDGFKSFADFSLDLPPFLVLIGGNATGKSNLLDALRLLPSGGWDMDADNDVIRGGPLEQFHQVTREY
jgi:AAA15 family ATPase/GTPase